MSDPDAVCVSLDSLNPKQRAKEYKAAVKEVKSKDLEAKIRALDRLGADCRYYTEGGCFLPLIECITPKKKVADVQKIALDALLRFFEAPDPKVGGQEAVLCALKAVVEAQGSLKSLEVLANLMMFREEVKKPLVKSPKKKKGEEAERPEAPVVEENPVVVELRCNSLKALYYLSAALSQVDRSDSAQMLLIDHFASVPGLASNLSSLFMSEFLVKFKDPGSRPSIIQEGVWALQVVVLLLKGNTSEETLQSLLAYGFIDVIPVLLEEGEFALSCAQITEVMAESSCGLKVLEQYDLLLDLLSTSSAAVASYAPSSGSAAATAAAVPVKGKAPAPSAEVPVAPVSGAGEGLRTALSQVKVVSKIFTSLARRYGESMSGDISKVARIVADVSSVLAVKEIAESINSRGQGATESIRLADFVDVCCTLLGALSAVSKQARRVVCAGGGADALCTVLQRSEELVLASEGAAGGRDAADGALLRRRLTQLRHAAGKALLGVVTEESVVAHAARHPRWPAYQRYNTDETLFSEQAAGAPFDFLRLIELLARVDGDLGDCSVKLLCLIINGAEDAQAFLAALNVEAALLPKLAALVDSRCEALCAELAASLAAGGVDDTRDGPLSSAGETLYMCLSVAEVLLRGSAASAASFATVDRLAAFGRLLRLCAALRASSTAREVDVWLSDPRDHPWLVPEEVCGGLAREKMLLRPLLLDVLAVVASLGSAASRDDEGGLLADSPHLEGALCVGLICGDATLTSISSLSGLCCSGSRIAPQMQPVDGVAYDVLHSAMQLLQAVVGCGARGLCALLESIAAAHKASLDAERAAECVEYVSTLSPLLQAMRARSGQDFDEAAAAWARPVRFDEVFPTGADPLQQSAGWPFFVLASSLVGVVMNPALGPHVLDVAVRVLDGMCSDRYTRAESHRQPVVCDVFCAAFLSMGGLVALSGALGRFGTSFTASAKEGAASPDAAPLESARPLGLLLMTHLVRRGADREAYWREFAAVAPEPSSAPPEVKVAAKAEPLKGAPAAPAKSSAPSLVPEVQLLHEPDGIYPDPNHGPGAHFWLALLDESHSDAGHTRCPLTNPLLSCIQGGLSDIALELLRVGADFNASEAISGLSPLMFALLLGDEGVVRRLVSTPGVDLDALDANRNPVLKYACVSAAPEAWERSLATTLPRSALEDAPSELRLHGRPAFLHLLLSSSVDSFVSDADGNGPIMWCLGQCELSLVLGGFAVHVSNWAYSSGCFEPPVIAVALLRSRGAQSDLCNRKGVVPLHVAAARGDVQLMQELVSHGGANPAALDARGNLPLHYLAAACPDNAPEAFDALLELSQYKYFERKQFSDGRTGMSADEKFAVDFERSLAVALADAVSPAVISMRRVSIADLLLALSFDGMSMLQLCMCAHVTQPKDFYDSEVQYLNHIRGSKNERITLALRIAAHASEAGVLEPLLSNVSQASMSTLHAAALMLQGRFARVELTAQQRRSKKAKYYDCAELELLDKLRLGESGANVDLLCQLPMPMFNNEPWNALRCALARCNEDLAADMFHRSSAAARTLSACLALACCLPPGSLSEPFLEALVISAPQYFEPSQINAPFAHSVDGVRSSLRNLSPLLHAIVNRNAAAVTLLGRLPQVDPNCLSGDSLPYNVACSNACDDDAAALVTLRSMGDVFFDRLDLTLSDAKGETCVHVLLRRDRLDLLAELLSSSKRNDVITVVLERERYCNSGVYGESLLFQMERENYSLACRCGLLPEQDPATDVEGDASARRDEVLAADAAQQLLRSERWVKLVLGAVVATGVVGADAHFMDVYCQGQTFAEVQLGMSLE